jgi:hypothetical protein
LFILGILKDFKQPQQGIQTNFLDSSFKVRFENLKISEKSKDNAAIKLGRNPLHIHQDYLAHMGIEAKNNKIAEVETIKQNLDELEKLTSELPIIKLNSFFKIERKARRIRKSQLPINTKIKCKVEGCKYIALSTRALGGHMSKAHKNHSSSFLQKKMAREKNEDKRVRLERMKKIFGKKNGFNYDELMLTKEGRAQWNLFYKESSEAFARFKRNITLQNP